MGRWQRYGYIGYFALLFISFLPYLSINRCYIDEVTLLAEAKRVLMGEHQHRDFFSFYGGLNFYLIALIWRITGSIDYQSIKLLTFIFIIGAGVLLTIVARRYTSNFWLSLLPSLIYVGYLGHSFPFTNHHWFGSGATVLFLYFLVRFLFDLRVRDLYYCGLAGALSLLFIMHEGIVNSGMGIFTILAALLFVPATERENLTKMVGYYLAGFATLMVPTLLFYLSIGAVRQYIYNTFIWPFTNYVQPGSINNQKWAVDLNIWTITESPRFAHPLFFFSLCAIMFVLLLPLCSMLIAGAMATTPKSFPQSRGANSYFHLIVMTAFSFGIYATAFSQPTLIKLIWGSVPALILMVMFLDWGAQRLLIDTASRRAGAIILAFILIAIVVVPVFRVQKLLRGDYSELAGTEVMRFDHPVVNLINSESGRQDYYFGYKWASFFYYAVDARPATPYTQLHENYLSQAQLRDLADNIARHRPKFITFSNEQDLIWLTSQVDGFPKLLNDNYRLRGRYENWLVYQLKE